MKNLLIKNTKKFYKGYLAVCDAVAETLGGEGKLALLENTDINLAPKTTKDGVSVALNIRFNDKFINFGALAAIQASAQTLQKSGDSTTTCLVFAQGFLRNINKSKFNKTVEIGINKGYNEVLNAISNLKQNVDSKMLTKIATTSANNDYKLGKKIIEAYDEVGINGIVNVIKNYDSQEVQVISKNGMKIENGYASPFFINNENKAIWEGNDVLVACLEAWQSDDKITDFIKKNRKKPNDELQPILIFMEKSNPEFIDKLITLNKLKNTDICLVIAPGGRELVTTTNIKDLAVFTGGVSYHNSQDEVVFGRADYISSDAFETIVISSQNKDVVKDRIEDLKKQPQDTFVKERIQRLEGVSCTISVGGNSTNDVDEIFDRVEDALASVKSASKDGFIAGGGSTLAYISERMNTKFTNSDIQLGYDLVKKVLNEPALRIVRNANRKHSTNNFSNFFFGSKNYLEAPKKDYGIGYNAKTDKISDLVSDGIIDSAKSIVVALDSAKESAVKMLLTNVIVTFPEKENWWEKIFN